MEENTEIQPAEEPQTPDVPAAEQNTACGNVFRRHEKNDLQTEKLARHRLWMNSMPHEYPMPYAHYRIGVYIRYYNQTKHKNYLEKHMQQFLDDIALCPNWTLVDFYVDRGSSATRMENSKEWCRLLGDCFGGKVDLIVTQKVSNVSRDPQEMILTAQMLAAQKRPVGIYFISEDIFTLASYYRQELSEPGLLPMNWEVLPEDELDEPMISTVQRQELPYSRNEEIMNEQTGTGNGIIEQRAEGTAEAEVWKCLG